MRLSDWDSEQLTLLGWKLRVMPTRLVGNERRFERLEASGLINRSRIPVARFRLKRPMVTWPSDEAEAELRRAPHRLAKRWARLVHRHEEVVWISQRGIELHGGYGGFLRQRLQIQHDLGTAHVFFRKSREDREKWMGEDWLRYSGQLSQLAKLPDAVLLDAQGRIEKLIEFASRYSKVTLIRLHRTCVRLGVAYEIW